MIEDVQASNVNSAEDSEGSSGPFGCPARQACFLSWRRVRGEAPPFLPSGSLPQARGPFHMNIEYRLEHLDLALHLFLPQ